MATTQPVHDDTASSEFDDSKRHSHDISHNQDVERNVPATADEPADAATADAAADEPMQTEKPAGPPPGAVNPMANIPDGGMVAWLQVAGSWSLFFNTWGQLNTFGIFQTYYERGTLFQETSSNIAWVGAVQAFLVLFMSLFVGSLFDRGYLRMLLLAGTFFIVFGYMMTSLCTEFYQVVLAQGFCIGIGGGLLFIPAVALLPSYFRRKLGLAVGIAASGSSMGGIIYPIVFYKLVDRIGFGWTTRVLGFIALATLIPSCIVLKMRFKPAKARSIIDTTAFSDVPYLVFVACTFVGFIGLYVVIFYISYFGGAKGITDASLTFYLVPILNAGSVLGRTVPNAISDKTGPLNIIGPGGVICAILVFCLIAVKNVGGLVVIALLYGFFSGVFIALPPVCIAMITQDKSKIGTRLGMAFGSLATSVLIGGPAGGAILGANSFTKLWVFGGVVALASGLLLIAFRMWRAGFKLVVKI